MTPVDTSAEAVAALRNWLLVIADAEFLTSDDLPQLPVAAATLAAVVKERDEAKANNAEWGRECKRTDADRVKETRARQAAETRADTASRQLAEAREILAGLLRVVESIPTDPSEMLYAAVDKARAFLSGNE